MRWVMSALLSAVFLACSLGSTEAGVVFIPTVIPIPVQVPPASTGGYDRIHTVAVISAIGTGLTMRNNHFSGSKSSVLNIDDWKVDERVETMLRRYLGSRFVFKDTTYDRSSLAQIPNGPLDMSNGALRKYLASLDNAGLDAFIVVRPDLEYQAPGMEGLALEHGNVFGDTPPTIWANYEVEIVDAKSLEIIAKSYSRLNVRASQQDTFAGLITDDRLKLGDELVPSAQQRNALRAVVDGLVTASMIETLRSLQLGVVLPPPDTRVLVPIPTEKMPYPNIKSVAVVSAIGAQLDLERIATIFSRGSASLPVPDWQLDSEIEGAAKERLRNRFTVKDVPVDRVALTGASVWDANNQLNPKFPGLSPSQDVDAYVVFVKVIRAVPGTEHMWADTRASGPGIWDNAVAKTAIFANYAVALVDAHTLKIISAREAITSPAYSDIRPYQVVDDSFWPGIPPNLTPLQADKIQSAMRALLEDSTQETLLALGLTGMMVDNSALPAANTATAPLSKAPQH